MVVAGHLSLAPDQPRGLAKASNNGSNLPSSPAWAWTPTATASPTAWTCPSVDDQLQNNHDGDSSGDACDADGDNDGVGDLDDRCPSRRTSSTRLVGPRRRRLRGRHRGRGRRRRRAARPERRMPEGEVGGQLNQSLDRDQDSCVDAIEDADADNVGSWTTWTPAGPSSLLGGSA